MSSPPPLIEGWKAWLLFATLIASPPAVGTAVLTGKIDALQATVQANTRASKANTDAVNKIMLALASRESLLGTVKDHEARIRALERR